MKLTRAATYGISACSYLASAPAGEVVSNTTICEAYQMPDRFVLQVMRMLVTAGIVTSLRGRDGGYKLAKLASKITLLEIVDAIVIQLSLVCRVITLTANRTAGSSTIVKCCNKGLYWRN